MQHRSQRNAEPLHLLKFDLVPFQASDCAVQRFDLLKYSHISCRWVNHGTIHKIASLVSPGNV
jgi:hypothetical protein